MSCYVSIYRLIRNNLYHTIRGDLADIEPYEVDIAGHRTLRADRVSDDTPPSWARALATMSGHEYPYQRRSTSALLLVELDGDAYALAFGHGWRMLAEDAYERDFGIRIALRCLQADQIREVIRTELGTGARLDLTHVAGGTDVRVYGIEQAAEVVRKIGGRTDALALTHLAGRKHFALEGRHALKVPLATRPGDVINDLRAVQATYDKDPVPELAFIENLRPLNPGSARHAAAERTLADQLASASPDSIGLTLPIELLGHTITEYRIEIGGDVFPYTDIELAAVAIPFAALPTEERLETLRHGKVHAVLDDGDSDPITTPMSHWLAADLPHGDDRIVYQYGTFYETTAAYREMLRAEAERLMSIQHPWSLPPWAAGVNERGYNEQAGSRSGWVNLDRDLNRSATHPKGIEICDLVAPDGALVCVKRADSSAPLSHLFNQAIVAAEALRDGNQARKWLEARLPAEHRRPVPHNPHFIFAIQLKRRKLAPDSLFTFSQATLHRAARRLERMGMTVSVLPIKRPSSTRGSATGR